MDQDSASVPSPVADAATGGRLGAPHVVIVGAGFGGLEAARALAGKPVRVTLVDRRNYHLFQPLLYQVAASTLSATEIAAPVRHILRAQKNLACLMAEVAGVHLARRQVRLAEGRDLAYDYLVLAAGSGHSYFGHDDWAPHAPGLKTLEEALEIRRRFLSAFEQAEQAPDPDQRRALLTFVVVGAGPTGVELAGTLKEMARLVLPREFRRIHAERARVLLVEAGPAILPGFGDGLSAKAQAGLERIGVEVRLGVPVTGVDAGGIRLGGERIEARTVLWAAGVAASPLGRSLGIPLDKAGRVPVGPDLAIPGHPEAFVIGDLAAIAGPGGRPLPGLAPVAIQAGRAAARAILARLRGAAPEPFRYRDRGSMATIGRGRAIAQIGRLRLDGFPAWLAWLFIHLLMLVGYQNRILVLVEWLIAYLTTQHRSRLILAPFRPWLSPATPAAPAAPDRQGEVD
jgi:NADH dehydrogenase